MPVDTSIYAPLIKRVDPAEQASQYASFSNAMAQNQLLQNQNQQYQAKVGAGKLLSQAINPKTGQLDSGKYNALIAQNPDLAPYAAEALSNSNSLSLGQSQAASAAQTLIQDKVKAYQSHLGLFSQILAPIAASDNPTKADAYKAASQLISNPDLDPETRQQLVGDSVQFLGDLPDDPAVIKQRIKGLQLQVQDAGTRLAAITGQTGLVNTGSEQKPITTNAYTGTIMPANGSPIPNTLTPGDASTLQEVTNPDGTKSYITKGEALHMRQGAPGAPGPQGEVAGAHAGSAQPQNIGSALSPGRQAALAATGQQSAQFQGQDIDSLRGLGSRTAITRQALGLLNDVKTGKGTEGIATLRNYLGTMSPDVLKAIGIGSKDDLEKAGNYQELTKYLVQLTQLRGQGFASGTDLQRMTAMKGNPNNEIPPDQLRQLLIFNQGVDRAEAARAMAMNTQGVAPENYGIESAKWSSHVDPRAFATDLMSPQERAALWKRISKDPNSAEYQNFVQSAKLAHRLNIVPIPSGQ